LNLYDDRGLDRSLLVIYLPMKGIVTVNSMTKMCCALLVLIAGISATNTQKVFAADGLGPTVTVTGGKIEGRLMSSGSGAVFKGIPFAQPPVGDLRWREPQPVKPWSDVRQAGDYAATCAQSDSGWNKVAAAKGSEDCLYLNVWAPEWPSKSKKAVMVWVHGGGNTGGSALGAGGIEPPFDGASLASHGVVVVTLQYRLGIFGFMGHSELTAESPHHASGGYGLLDQAAALQWVHDNIASFGGDPANVTLFGQSAGAQNTTILVSSPLTRGLIAKAIAESGTPMIGDKRLQSPAQMEQAGAILAQTLKAPSSGAIQYMRGFSTAQILAALPEFRKSLSDAHLIQDVGMDGYAVPQFPPEVYRSGKEPAIPLMIGSNGRDNPGQRVAPPNSTPEEVQSALKAKVESLYSKYPELSERALKAYGFSGSSSDVSNYPPYGPVDIQYGTDLSMRCEADVLAGWHSAIAPTYQYEFNAGNATHPPMHSAELDFVFGYLREQGSEANLKKLSEQMQEYWTNFAKMGDPNGAGLPKWPKHDAKARAYVELSNEGVAQKNALRSGTCDIYAEKLNRDLDARKK
jgi:para-nitrobenzyl esterase